MHFEVDADLHERCQGTEHSLVDYRARAPMPVARFGSSHAVNRVRRQCRLKPLG
jgi:hypothetical protein